MVFGIGAGSIEITTEKQSYARGEYMRGTVALRLNSPKKARGVRVKFYAERRDGKRKYALYRQEKWLDDEKEYPARRIEYPFEFAIEPRHPKPTEGVRIIEGVVNALFDADANLRWYLNASLDIPNSLDVNKTQRVEIK